MTDHLGIGPEEVAYAQAAAARGDFEAAISQRVLDHFALYGAPHDIIEQIERMAAETQVTRIEFGMPHGPDGSVEALHLLGKQVVPHFAKS